MKKMVYYFGKNNTEGSAEMKALLGGKGANLAEMAQLGLPVRLPDTSHRAAQSHVHVRSGADANDWRSLSPWGDALCQRERAQLRKAAKRRLGSTLRLRLSRDQ